MATRKSSAASTHSKHSFKERDELQDKIEQRGFDKALKEALKERNVEKRLQDIKTNFESNKYEDLFIRLVDAENKNEYLTNLLTQLQAKQSVNNEYR